MQYRELREEFREEYLVLESQIFSSINGKREMAGQLITGTFMGDLFEKYVAAIAGKGILKELAQLPTQKELVSFFLHLFF